MHVLVITTRDLEKASTKYRIVQYREALKNAGVELTFIRRDDVTRKTLPQLRDYDLVFNQKCLYPVSFARRILAASRCTLFDFDDAVYTRPGNPYGLFLGWRTRRRLALWLTHASIVTTANRHLAGYAHRYRERVDIVPMTLNLKDWFPRSDENHDCITLGWGGAPVNIPHLERIGQVLQNVLRKHPQCRLKVFSGQKPNLPCEFDYVPFQPGAEPEFARSLDIGLLPILDEEFTRGKSPVKALQYLASAIPVVGNVNGATAEILNDTNSIRITTDPEWEAALSRLILDADLRRQLGKNGRQFVEQHHSLDVAARQLLQILNETRRTCEVMQKNPRRNRDVQ